MKINKLSIVVSILARDCAPRLHRNISRVEKLLAAARVGRVVIVENDSVDGTKEVLANWAARDERVTVICKDHNAEAGSGSRKADRISRMASYRNAYLDFIDNEDITVDLVVMIDIDAKSFDVDGIIRSIESAPVDFAALFANGTRRVIGSLLPFYYDLYAFVPAWGKAARSLAQMRANGRELQDQMRVDQYVECQSAFGGIGVYRYDAIKGNCYSVAVNSERRDEVLCEHIPFNSEARGKCYVAREMRLNYGRRTLRGLLWQTFATDKMFEKRPKFI